MNKKESNNRDKMIGIGLALGVAFGAAIDNVGLGICLGLAIGAGLGFWIYKENSTNDEKE